MKYKLFLVLSLLIFSFNVAVAEAEVWRSISVSSEGKNVTLLPGSGQIYNSSDFGATWNKDGKLSSKNWWSSASSSSGQYSVSVVGWGGPIYTSSDFGVTWIERESAGNLYWSDVDISTNGEKMVAVASGNYIYTSSDFGVTWARQNSSGSRAWYAVEMSSDGKNMVAVVANGYIYTSSDFGVSWTERRNTGRRAWWDVAMSSQGSKIFALDYNGFIYTSSDFGENWEALNDAGQKKWERVAVSSDGSKVFAVVSGGYFYVSLDSGKTWTERQSSGTSDWSSVASSNNGEYIFISSQNGKVYKSVDLGQTWELVNFENKKVADDMPIVLPSTTKPEEVKKDESTKEENLISQTEVKTTETNTFMDASNVKLCPKVPVPSPSTFRTLRQGERSEYVKTLQQALNCRGYKVAMNGIGSSGNETDYFGSLTKGAVITFQRSRGLKTDGIIGPKTVVEINKDDITNTEIKNENKNEPTTNSNIQTEGKDGFPYVFSQNRNQNNSTLDHKIFLPSYAKGDLLMVLFSGDFVGGTSYILPEDWKLLSSGEKGKANLLIAYKFAEEKEAESFSIKSSNAGPSVFNIFSIRGYKAGSIPEVAKYATDFSKNPNPPILTPYWGESNTLWFSIVALDVVKDYVMDRTPDNYLVSINPSVGSGLDGATISFSTRPLKASFEDPSMYTLREVESDWVATTLGIRGI